MTDQHQHRATDEQWHRVEITELLQENPRSPLLTCLLELRDRIQLLEATQHAHIEAKSSEAGAVDRVLALQDQIRDGALSLADALKEIGASEPAKDPFRRPSLADTLADSHHFQFFNTSVLIRAFKDWLTQEGKAPLAMRELLEAQAQIAESDPHA